MSYREIRRETAQRMGEDEDRGGARIMAACTFCGAPTAYDTLAMLGARCSRCYAAFCATLPAVVKVPDGEAIPAGAPEGLWWAYRLRWRHECGEPLSRVQIDAFRSALARRHDATAAAAQ